MAQLVGSSLVQAFSFVGAQWLFSQLNHKDYQKEMARHNKALEDLTRQRHIFFEEEAKRNHRIQQLERESVYANKDFSRINRNFEELSKLKKEQALSKEPVLSDFYTPSEEMKHYQNLAAGAMGLAGGGVTGLLLSYVL